MRLIVLSLFIASTALAGGIEGTVAGAPRLRRDAVVYLADAPKVVGKSTVNLDQKGMVFVPHVLPIVKGTTVKFLNSDVVRHNVFSPDKEKYNLGTWPVGETKSYVFDKCTEEICVYTQLCNVHTEMEGFVVVLQTDKFALVKPDGSFSIPGVAAGTYTVKLWSPKKATAAPMKVTVAADGTAKVALTIAP